MSNEEINENYKRKRKKTFLQNARKYAKKGWYGRGSQMDADTYQYFVGVLEAYKEGFDNDDDKMAFVQNVFKETENREIECSCNQVGCRVVEMLLPFADNNVLKRFICLFDKDIRPLSKDKFGSFVFQCLIRISTKKVLFEKGVEDITENFRNFIIKTSKFLLNNLEDYIWDQNGNHVIRTCLIELVQLPNIDHKPHGKDLSINQELTADIPKEFLDVVKEYGERLIQWPQFGELCGSERTSGFLQVLLRSLKLADKNLLKLYLEKLLNEVFLKEKESSTNILLECFLSIPALRLLETSLELSSKKMYRQFYNELFSNRILQLAKMKSTNFAIQKLITHCYEKEQFEAIFDELATDIKGVLEANHTSVVLALTQTCKRLGTRQGLLLQSMMKSLNCFEPEERQQQFVMCMCRLVPFSKGFQKVSNENLHKEQLSLQGTLMLQVMLEFNKPIKLVNIILNMDTVDLKNLFSNSMASHVVDSFVQSPYIGEKSREKLLRKMKGTYQGLASSKYGSRSFEAMWKVANMKMKLQIMEELIYKDGSWSNSEHGKIIAAKVNLTLFKRNKENWKMAFGNVEKVEELFADILK
ncbi:nucleolar protein 9 [Cylas formicarius]|uniref:nucleolar protein 9 n=1 Tax=Cylas formicarius TaxID=197179 RepID=UPI00295897D3|nr:nucleolar protein 9 [Cylas formicarius]